MVRKDPLNQRGPAIPGKEYKTKPIPTDLFMLQPLDEYQRLWDAVLTNLESAVRQVCTLDSIGTPGLDSNRLVDMAHLLNSIKNKQDTK